jgi:tetratricopeptide (TPR) repeat protein
VLRERRPQLVTLVGVPGIGKSRLVQELFRTTESGVFGPVYWRHGPSLPYGEGVTFWALAEIMKAHAGILESDSAEQAHEKLQSAVQAAFPDAPEAGWIEKHLRPLAGLSAEESWAGGRAEAFAAWSRFLEALAEKRPLVLVFEDLHWADEALLDFIDYVVDRASGVPLLALCTARPELLARRPRWGGGKVNSSTILLSALSEAETTALVHALLGRIPLADDARARLLEHAGGNPLYAEEFTRMLAARPTEAALPETVQGIIAARLDTLPREEKELLQDAAVVGKVFWLGALGRERWPLEERLYSLERNEFVSRQRRSSVAGEEEYAFCHALVREVAYEQIPRAQRAGRHRAAAAWIESLGRPEDHAEMVAHHYLSAVELARVSGEPTEELAASARVALRDAGDRAFSLHAFPAAAKLYSEALALWPEGDPERARTLFDRAHALQLANDDAGADALEQARDALLAEDDRESAAEAEALLANIWWFRGERDHAAAHLERAAEFIGQAPSSPSKARVLSELARQRMLANELDQGIRLGREAAAMAEAHGLDEIQASALNTVGTARVYLGDEEGRADVERSVEIALAAGSLEVVRGMVNLGALFLSTGNVPRATELYEEAARAATRFGDAVRLHGSRGDLAELEFHAGRWDEAHRLGDPFIAECEAGSPHYSEVWARTARASMRIATGDQAGALDDETAALRVARAAKDPQTLQTGCASAARVYGDLGRWEEADALVSEILSRTLSLSGASSLADLSWAGLRLGRRDDVRAALERIPGESLWLDACRAVLDEAFERAAEIFASIGSLPNEAYARLRAGEKLLAEGHTENAEDQLGSALTFYRRVGATAYAREAEELLSRAGLEIPA